MGFFNSNLSDKNIIISKEGIVTEEINEVLGTGQIKVLGQTWKARPINNNEIIKKDSIVIVENIVGVSAMVKTK